MIYLVFFSCLIHQQQIDGKAFLLLTQRDIVKIMSVKLGPALKIYNSILMFKHGEDNQSASSDTNTWSWSADRSCMYVKHGCLLYWCIPTPLVPQTPSVTASRSFRFLLPLTSHTGCSAHAYTRSTKKLNHRTIRPTRPYQGSLSLYLSISLTISLFIYLSLSHSLSQSRCYLYSNRWTGTHFSCVEGIVQQNMTVMSSDTRSLFKHLWSQQHALMWFHIKIGGDSCFLWLRFEARRVTDERIFIFAWTNPLKCLTFCYSLKFYSIV